MQGYVRCIFTVLPFLAVMACGGRDGNTSPPPISVLLPSIHTVDIVTSEMKRYQKAEMLVDLTAQYTQPYDQRDVALQAVFTGPDDRQMSIPGFWDGVDSWRVRFTPPLSGEWLYAVTVTDRVGSSKAKEGAFEVSSSSKPGWLQIGSQVDASYSDHYLVHHDGSPFYGVGHADVFRVFHFNPRSELNTLFDIMRDAGENYFLWWPQFYFPLAEERFDTFDMRNINTIDTVLAETEKEGQFLIFTIWDHSQLRDDSHPWADGRWSRNNGFRRLVSAGDFFVDAEAWAWQTNVYRYMIARWAYSPAIAMWQTVSEIEGTNAFGNANVWHEKINHYFAEHDPYRHPTTASMAGDKTWDKGHAVMDVPQVHIYQDLLDPSDKSKARTVDTAKVIAGYTRKMWDIAAKPNWIGEFGMTNDTANENKNYYPELFHNAIWAALGAGAAMTPAEWNDFNRWGVVTPEMKNHLNYFSQFVENAPLAKWAPVPLAISSDNPKIRAWGIAGERGGLVWVQDFALAGLDITQIRQQKAEITGVQIRMEGLVTGAYRLFPYDTWRGVFGEAFEITCSEVDNAGCPIVLPPFTGDMAFRLEAL